MVRRMATTSKVPVAPGLFKEERFTFQRKIQELVTWCKIPKELIINFDQTPLSYITVGHFSVLDLYLQVLSKKSIWYFDVTWLILQQFTRRDLKPAAFL